MKSHILLKRFDLVADTVENIPHLRRLIVDLAVRGKLVKDELGTATPKDVIARIAEQRANLVKEGKIRKQKPLPPVSSNEIPGGYGDFATFERLANIAILEKGLTGIQSAKRGEYPLVVTAENRSTCDHFDFEGSAAIIPMVSSAGHGKASLKRLHFQEGKFALGSILCAAFPIDGALISARFLFEYLTVYKEELLVAKMIGTANVSLTIGKIGEVPVPIISQAAQRRVDELMALCDRLEAAQTEREQRRQRLAAATHAGLATAETEADTAAFLLQHFPRLTTRLDQIPQLRQTILNLAVRGKLVKQDKGDELVTKCLERCDLERVKVSKTDRRADAESQDLLVPELRWQVPACWNWRGLADLVLFIDYRGQTPNKIEQGVRLITAKNVKKGFINQDPEEFLSEKDYHTWMTRGFPKIGDILFTTEAPMGNAAVVKLAERFALAQRVICFSSYGAIDPDFLVLQIIATPFQSILDKTATGLTAKGIKAAKLKRLPIVVPPLAEQKRIVARVEELMGLCDRLEAQLKTTQTDSRRFLEAVLHSALAG